MVIMWYHSSTTATGIWIYSPLGTVLVQNYSWFSYTRNSRCVQRYSTNSHSTCHACHWVLLMAIHKGKKELTSYIHRKINRKYKSGFGPAQIIHNLKTTVQFILNLLSNVTMKNLSGVAAPGLRVLGFACYSCTHSRQKPQPPASWSWRMPFWPPWTRASASLSCFAFDDENSGYAGYLQNQERFIYYLLSFADSN